MYVLDTHVVSELRKAGRADSNVVAWASKVATGTLYVSAVTLLEIELGILSLERRDQPQASILRVWMQRHVLPAFEGRVLAIDTAVALQCAQLHVPNRRAERDALIAATAIVHGMTVVTRNVGDFEGTGALLINPWAP
jgi:predicted nucleic acid-binding protein